MSRRSLTLGVGIFVYGNLWRYFINISWVMTGMFMIIAGMFCFLNYYKNQVENHNKQTKLKYELWDSELVKSISILLIIFLSGSSLMAMETANTKKIYNLFHTQAGNESNQTANAYVDEKYSQPVIFGSSVIGTVVSCRDKSEKNHILVVESLKYGKILVKYYNKFDVQDIVGMKVRVTGEIKIPDAARNPGCFDYRLYLKTKKIYLEMKAFELKTAGVSNKFIYEIHKFRTGFERALSNVMDQDSKNITIAMIFGDKTSLDKDVYKAFQRNGTAHILAISGLHIGVIYGFLSKILLAKRKKFQNIFILLLLALYCILAEFAPSVVRAVIMISLHVFSKLFHFRYDLITAASIALLLSALANPYSIFGTGLGMSYLTILVLTTVMKFFNGVKLPKVISSYLLPVIVIQICMTPYTIYLFNYFSISSLPANIPIIFLAGFIIPLALVAVPIYLFIPKLMGLIGFFIKEGVRLIVWCNDLFYHGGIFSFDVPSPDIGFIIGFYVLLFFLTSEWFLINFTRGAKGKLSIALLILFIMVLIIYPYVKNDFRNSNAMFVDVGQGACMHVRTDTGKNILIDGGGKESFPGNFNKYKGNGKVAEEFDVGAEVVKPYLLKNGVRKVDIAFVSHLDGDHFKGIASLCKLKIVKKVVFPDILKPDISKILADTKMKKENLVFIKTGASIPVGDVSFQILGPVNDEGNGNSNSMVIKMIWANCSIIMPGDIDSKAEESLLKRYGTGKDGKLKCDILSAPHHGSKSSSKEEFIKAVNPNTVIIQSGANNRYGHPAPETLERYKNNGSKIIRNDKCGGIGIFGLGKGVKRDIKVRTTLQHENILRMAQ